MKKEQIMITLISVAVVSAAIAGIAFAKFKEVDRLVTKQIVEINGGQQFPFMLYDDYIRETSAGENPRDYMLVNDGFHSKLEEYGIAAGVLDLIDELKEKEIDTKNNVYDNTGKDLGGYAYEETTLVRNDYELQIKMLKNDDHTYVNIVGSVRVANESQVIDYQIMTVGTEILRSIQIDTAGPTNQEKG